MGVIRIDHIGVAVESLENVPEAIKRLLSPHDPHVEDVPEQGVRTTSFRTGGGAIEFLESIRDDGPVHRYLAKKGSGIHHVALEVEDLDDTLAELRGEGVDLIDEEPRPGAEGRRIAFIHPKAAGGILIELCDRGAP